MIKIKRIEVPIGNGETMLSKKEISVLDKIKKRWGICRTKTVVILIKKYLLKEVI